MIVGPRNVYGARRAILAACVVAGCAQNDTSESERAVLPSGEAIIPTIRSEEGVTVFEHGPDALARAPQWTLQPEPISTIGGADSDPQYDLTYVSYVVPLSDGRVMTFARIGNKVFVFNREGKGERTIGRTGQGPGDWMRFGDPVLLEDDTLLVLDFANNRLNWVTADGGIVRTAPYVISGETRGMSFISGFLASGDLLMHSASSWGGHQTDSLNRSLARIVTANIETGNSRVIATIPDLQGVQYETRYRGRSRTEMRPVRLGGWALVAGWDSVFATASPSSPEIELRDAGGVLRGKIVVPLQRRAVTEAIRDARIAMELERVSAPGREARVDAAEDERLAREAPFADSLPFFEQLLTGSDGTLWAVDAIAPDDSGWTATAFRKDGAILGRLSSIVSSRPMAFGPDRVIVRSEDENGVVRLQVFPIVPATAR